MLTVPFTKPAVAVSSKKLNRMQKILGENVFMYVKLVF
jgi:hypothetical protein